MKKYILLAALCILFLTSAIAQNNVGVGTTTPNASAALDVQSTTQGMLVPRMTKAQRDLIATPAQACLSIRQTTRLAFIFIMRHGQALTIISATTRLRKP